MILPFPNTPSDWLTIWNRTKTMTLLSSEKRATTIPIISAEKALLDSNGKLIASKISVSGGDFFISFKENIEALENQLTYFILDNNPRKGHWNIPSWYIEYINSRSQDD